MSNPSLEAVIALKPDVVVLTKDGNPKEFEGRLRSLNVRTYVFSATRIADLPAEILKMGKFLGAERRARVLAARIESEFNHYRNAYKRPSGKRAVFIVWPEPLLVAGPDTAVDDALRLLGWGNVASGARARYPRYSIEELILQAPDVILIGKGHKDMKALSGRLLKRLNVLKAVKNGRVYYTGDFLYRLGPRVIEGIRELEGILYNKSGAKETGISGNGLHD